MLTNKNPLELPQMSLCNHDVDRNTHIISCKYIYMLQPQTNKLLGQKRQKYRQSIGHHISTLFTFEHRPGQPP